MRYTSVMIVFATNLLACDRARSPDNLEVVVAPLALPGIDFACYDLLIENQDREAVVTLGDPTTSLDAAEPDPNTICSTRYGNGAGGAISYVAPCDASSPTHTVTLWVDGLYRGTQNSPMAVEYQDPCPNGCELETLCTENADTPVEFNLTIMRPALQGFFDIVVDFDDIFCSAKVDCADEDGPLELLFDPMTGERAQTAVLAFACTAGAVQSGEPSATVLFRNPIIVDCGGEVTELDPTRGPGNVYGVAYPDPAPDDAVWQYATYVGSESLPCDGGSCDKRFWNVAIGFDPAAAGCTVVTSATAASSAAMPGHATPDNHVYPWADIAVNLTLPGGGLACGRHPLDGDSYGVTTRYTSVAATKPFCHRYDGNTMASAEPEDCTSGVAPSGGVMPLSITPSYQVGSENTPVWNLVDGRRETSFVFGDDITPAGLLFDLGYVFEVDRVSLRVDQFPYDVTHHEVWAGLDPDDLTLVGGFNQFTTSDDILELSLEGREARYVRIVTVASPSWIAWREINVFGRRAGDNGGATDDYCGGLNLAKNPNIQEFGYFASSAVYGDYASELGPHATMVFVANGAWNTCTGVPDPSVDIARILSARAQGLKSMIYLYGIFFDTNVAWNPNAAPCWDAYADALQPYADDIVGFYPIDEPHSNRLHALGLPVKLAATPTDDRPLRAAAIAELDAHMQAAAAMIKADFPDKPVAGIVYADEAAEADIPVPANYDWLGFDCYGSFAHCAGSGLSIPATLDRLKAKLGPTQRLVLVPDANLGGTVTTAPSLQSELQLTNIFENYLELALREPRVVAIMPFLWQTLEATPPDLAYGARDLSPWVRARYEEVGACFKAATD